MIKKELQELIDSATPYKAGQPLSSILLIPSGEPCKDAFNTDDQYENIIMLGISPVNDKLLYINKGSTSTDVLFSLMAPIAAIDLPTKYHGAIHVHFATWVKILAPENNAISPVKCDGTDMKITSDETAFVVINKDIPKVKGTLEPVEIHTGKYEVEENSVIAQYTPHPIYLGEDGLPTFEEPSEKEKPKNEKEN